jgi:isopentenyl diphosphate isomerase/L-lactate dehydrogenase-like FMN-dependent dehydrogenase
MHQDGATGVARAAAARGSVSVLSTVAGTPIEEVAPAAPGRVWFQLYASTREEAEERLERAARSEVAVLVVTLDTPALGNRERDLRHGVAPPLRLDGRNAVLLGPQVLLRPSWAWRMARDGIRLLGRADDRALTFSVLNMVDSPFTWQDVSWLRQSWAGALVVKGVLGGEDARKAVDCGADAVVVSNHGGRQLDGAPATLRVLPEVASAVGDRTEVLLDGGVRRGSHVVKALCLGARGVFVGRPYLFGLATAGQHGVEQVLDILEREMRRTMVLLGCDSAADLGPNWLRDRRA